MGENIYSNIWSTNGMNNMIKRSNKLSPLELKSVWPENVNEKGGENDNTHKAKHRGKENEGLLLSTQIHDFFENNVSIVGVRYVAMRDAAWFRRIIWFLLVIFGFSFMTYQFYDRIKYFTSNPTTVDIKANYKDELVFPTVTICNENIVKKEKATKLYGFGELIPEMYPAYPNPKFKPDFTAARIMFAWFEKHNTSWQDIWYWLSPMEFSESVHLCTFSEESCGQENFTIVPTSMGHCLQINGAGRNYTATRAGSTFGLSVMLTAEQESYYYSRSRAAGFRVLLHTKNDIPLVYELGFQAPAGSVTAVAIKLKTITNLPKPYGNCSNAEDYGYKRCTYNCLHEYVINRCGCKYYYYKSDFNKTCNPEEQYICADKAETEFVTQKLLNKLCDCPPQCTTHYFQHMLSTAPVSKLAVDSIVDILCESYNLTCDNKTYRNDLFNEVKDDYCEILIYYDELLHEEVTTIRAYPLLALLCDIGGALGLVLGSTVLTMFEIFDFLIVTVCHYFSLKIIKNANH